MPKSKDMIQDRYLQGIKDQGVTVRIVMTNGKQLTGTVAGFDTFTILISAGGVEVMVYKSAVAVIGPVGSEKA